MLSSGPAFTAMSERFDFVNGQRWVSETEPELGLGTLVQASATRVNLVFPASGELRQYARDNAPLKRVRFRVGDRITTHEDRELVVEAVREEHGLITYACAGDAVPEALLNDRISVHGPEERLLAGAVDAMEDFQLRRRSLEFQHRRRLSAVRGFVGGRIDLIPHQLYIAHEVSSRQAPRVLLSDEVGLGKTIEACLILHRLLVSGRASRVLILVPESLVHQWLVEMLRRFNIRLNIYDEERCAALESGQGDANPFHDDQMPLRSAAPACDSPKHTST
jgi:ATP-dependent helicase HepA